MPTCNGKCRILLKGYGAPTTEHGGSKSLYALGYKRCGCCQCFFKTEALYCQCCGQRLGWKPKGQAAYRAVYKHGRPTLWTVQRDASRI